MEEARKVIVVVAKVEREEQGNDERATNVVRQCRQGRRQGGQRTENRNGEKNKEEGSNTARHFYIGCVTCGAHLLARATK